MLEIADDFNSPSLSSFWNTRKIESGSLSITDELAPGEKPVLKITVHPGDFSEEGGDGKMTERAEIREEKDIRVPVATDIWYGFSLYIPKDFYITANRLVFAQWKQPSQKGQDPGSPFVSLRYREGNVIGQVVHESEKQKFTFSNVERGVWTTVLTNYFIDENNRGYCRFVVNGEEHTYEGEMGYRHLPTKDIYFKMGLYRDYLPMPQSLYFDKFRRGLSRDFCEE